MAGVIDQNAPTFAGQNDVPKGNVIQTGSITAGGNVNIGMRIYSEHKSKH
jgi:hypothetical protein